MNPKLQELQTKYRRFFSKDGVYVVGCGEGWLPIIEAMCSQVQRAIGAGRWKRARELVYNRALKRALAGNEESLARIYANIGYEKERIAEMVSRHIEKAQFYSVEEPSPQFWFTQIKEKYGELRAYFHVEPHDETQYAHFQGIIRMAAAMSRITCETCGNPGKMRGKAWLYVSCNEHAREADRE